jgi:hypothetical protein
MKRIILAIGVALAAVVAAAPATAKVPNGNGLTFVPASPVGVHCADGGTYSVLVTRNLGKSGWHVEASRHYVVGEFWITVTHTATGALISREGGAWGKKNGLASLRCWGGYDDPEAGVTITIDSVLYLTGNK